MEWMFGHKLIGVAGGMLGVLFMVPSVSAGTHKGFPWGYPLIYMPVSLLGVGTIRTPAFSAASRKWNDILRSGREASSVHANDLHDGRC